MDNDNTPSPRYIPILVLSDGETWETISDISGACASICVISEEEYHALAEGQIEPKNLNPVVELGMKNFTPFS